MPYRVALLNFEGPLDLLLQLVERSQLEASTLSLALVTEQYLDYAAGLKSINPLEASQFAALAAKLLYIKSLLLLPAAEPDSYEEIDDLQRQISAYGTYRNSARALAGMLATGQKSWGRPAQVKAIQAGIPSHLTLGALKKAYKMVTKPEIPPHRIAPSKISMPQMIERFVNYGGNGSFTLNGFFSTLASRGEVALGFIAALELARQNRLKLTQRDQFSIIEVDYATTHLSA